MRIVDLLENEYLPPGAGVRRSDVNRISRSSSAYSNKFVWLRPRDVPGSHSEDELRRMGFKQSSYGSWGGTQSMWNKLSGIRESVLDVEPPGPQDIIRKHGITEQQFIEQITAGIKVELEHTNNVRLAKDIALAHLDEDPLYYTKLASIGLEEDQQDQQNLVSVTVAKSNIDKILAAAQAQYDRWDEGDVDTYAGGGICHLIADDICSVLWDIGIECTTQSCSYEQHVYVVAKFQEGIYQVDIPYHVYERGAGFSWTKLPDIKFEPRDVVFYKISGDPEEWSNYVDLYEASGYIPSHRQRNDPRFSTALTVDVKPDSIQQNAKKLALGKISRAGRPPLLRK